MGLRKIFYVMMNAAGLGHDGTKITDGHHIVDIREYPKHVDIRENPQPRDLSYTSKRFRKGARG